MKKRNTLLLLALTMQTFARNASAATESSKLKITSVSVPIQHIAIKTDASFAAFTKKFEQQIGKFDFASFLKLMKSTAPASKIKEFVTSQEGSSGFFLFASYDHGSLLGALYGRSKKGIEYVVGNPVFAAQMTKDDFRAGLYAPLRVLVYAGDDGKAQVEYDLPSSLFGQFENPKVTAFSKGLDEKLSLLIEKSTQ